MPRGMLTGKWNVARSGIFKRDRDIFKLSCLVFKASCDCCQKRLALIAPTSCTLAPHQKNLELIFWGVQSGHGPNRMATRLLPRVQKRGGAIASQPCSSAPLESHQSRTCSACCIARANKKATWAPSPLTPPSQRS